MNTIHVCFATNDAYAPYCAVAIRSMAVNADHKDRLNIYVLYAELSPENINKLERIGKTERSGIELIKIEEKSFANMPFTAGAHFSHQEAYFRFAIPRIFPHLDKVLYLDCDILVLSSLNPLFHMDMQDKSVAMIPDTDKLCGGFNTGVSLINCKKWRKDSIESELLQYAQNHKESIKLVDQQIVNEVLKDKIYQLDDKWNRQIRFEEMTRSDIDQVSQDRDIKILHYVTSAKPWHGVFQNELVDEYFGYLYELPWDIKDNRQRNVSINAYKYYQCVESLRSLLSDKVINTDTTLVVLETTKELPEFEYAAIDLNFLNVSRKKLEQVSEACGSDSYFLLDSFYNAEIKKALDQKGYCIGSDYSFVRLLEHNEIEHKIFKNLGVEKIRGLQIAVYGTGEWAQKCTEVLIRNGANILCYIDSDSNKEGQVFCGKQIISPSKFTEREENTEIILLASSCYHEMRETLLDIGIKSDKIIEFDFMEPAKN